MAGMGNVAFSGAGALDEVVKALQRWVLLSNRILGFAIFVRGCLLPLEARKASRFERCAPECWVLCRIVHRGQPKRLGASQ